MRWSCLSARIKEREQRSVLSWSRSRDEDVKCVIEYGEEIKEVMKLRRRSRRGRKKMNRRIRKTRKVNRR